mmetsp:Transcript_17817/g.47018  ORF Transcript_17817/g.47018 Transcript_17817/m.47018 type:complete len:680 (+) Transcript_17817:72-2111(+)
MPSKAMSMMRVHASRKASGSAEPEQSRGEKAKTAWTEDSGDENGGAEGEGPAPVWKWLHKTGFKAYEEIASARIEAAYQNGRPYVRLKSGKKGTVPMEVFFVDMIQFDPSSGNTREIQRIGEDPYMQRLVRKLFQLHVSVQQNHSIRPMTFVQYKAQRREDLQLERKDSKAEDPLKDTGFCSRVVRSTWFFVVSMLVVLINAMWIGIDFDKNTMPCGSTDPIFIFMEQAFCTYFFIEVCLRFGAYRKTIYVLKDRWFLFDTSLVALMVLETWAVPVISFMTTGAACAEQLSQLTILRLARMLKLTRLTRLLKVFPELMTLLKGMVNALHSVLYTMVLLVVLIYIFGVMFATGARRDDQLSDELSDKFTSVQESMWVLLLDGTFLDGTGDTIKVLRAGSNALTFLFLIFIFMSSFTVLNMLIGILCEVVSQTSHGEKEAAAIEEMKTVITEMLECYDKDDDRLISSTEFDLLMLNPEMHGTLQRFSVDADDLRALKGYLFEHGNTLDIDGDSQLKFEEFLDIAFRLRGGNSATVRDIVELRDYLGRCFSRMDGFDKPGTPARLLREGSTLSLMPEPASPGGRPSLMPEVMETCLEAGGRGNSPVHPETQPLEVSSAPSRSPPNAAHTSPASDAHTEGSPRHSGFEREVLAQLARLAEEVRGLKEGVRDLQAARTVADQLQ